MTILRKVVPFAVVIAWMAAPGWAEAPRPLSGRGSENLVAFSRLLSLVRFFHPSDAAAAVDWNRVAVAGVDAAEGAADAPALARSLEDFFRPLAPALRVYPNGQRPEPPREARGAGRGGSVQGGGLAAFRRQVQKHVEDHEERADRRPDAPGVRHAVPGPSGRAPPGPAGAAAGGDPHRGGGGRVRADGPAGGPRGWPAGLLRQHGGPADPRGGVADV